MPWPGPVLINGSFTALGGAAVAALVAVLSRRLGREFTLPARVAGRATGRGPPADQRSLGVALFAGYVGAVSLLYPLTALALPFGAEATVSYPENVVTGFFFGVGLCLVSALAVLSLVVLVDLEIRERDRDVLFGHCLATGIGVGLWARLTPVVWWPFLSGLTALAP